MSLLPLKMLLHVRNDSSEPKLGKNYRVRCGKRAKLLPDGVLLFSAIAGGDGLS